MNRNIAINEFIKHKKILLVVELIFARQALYQFQNQLLYLATVLGYRVEEIDINEDDDAAAIIERKIVDSMDEVHRCKVMIAWVTCD